MTNDTLDLALRDLAAHVEFPSEPMLASAVGEHLRARARPVRVRAPRRPAWLRAPRRAAVAAVLALVLALTAVLTFSPTARQAVARWLGLQGARIETVPTLPPVPTRSPIDLLLGERVTLAEARARAEFPLRIPPALGPPDHVFFDEHLPGGRVTFAYDPTPEYPVSEHTGYGLLLSQFRGLVDRAFIHKYVPEGMAEQVDIDGEPGFWLGLEDHVLVYVGPDGEPFQDTLRLAGPALLWERDGITFRLEGDISRGTAVRIARSLR